MRNKTMLDLIKFKIKELNRYLSALDQRIELSDEKLNTVNEVYRDITWYRSIDRNTEAEEHVFGGNELELFATLNGIEYGIRMERHRYQV